MKPVALLLAGVAALMPHPAAAAIRAVIVSPAAMNVYPVYRDDVLTPGLLPKANETSFRVGITLPPDYKPGSTVQIRLLMQANTTTAACAGMFGVLYLDRARPGFSTYETRQPIFDGLSGGNIGTINFPANGKAVTKDLMLIPPKHAPFTGMNPGDNFLVWMNRYATNALDTCNMVTLFGAEVRYVAAY